MSNRLHDYINLIFDEVSHEEAAQKLFSHKSGAAKTKFIYEILKRKNILPKSLITSVPKSDFASLEARNEGNSLFKVKDFVGALECYNKSICLATSGSENLAIGYANRSAVYLNAGFYDSCLQNIEMALKNNYPEKLKSKLEHRRQECLKMRTNNERQELFKSKNKLSYEANNRIPIMINGLEYTKSEQFGRFIRATRDLFPGDVIIIEKPFSKCMVHNDWYTRCANCLETNDLHLIPCLECTRTMFCSNKCQENAWVRFHQIECPIIDGIISSFDASPTVILAIRQTLYSFTMFSNPKELEDLISTVDVDNESAFTIDYLNLNDAEHFRAIYAHTTNEFDHSFANVFRFVNACAGVWNLLYNYTDLQKMFLQTKAIENFFLELLFRFIQSTAFNCYNFAQFGVGSFALCSLLNHSCAPNVERVVNGSTNQVVVRRFIKTGDQLFDNYGPHHRDTELQERQRQLKTDYNFLCQCEACVYDYPMLKQMTVSIDVYTKLTEDRKLIKECDEKFVRKKLNKYRKYLTKNYKKYPSYEICATEANLIECLWTRMLTKPLQI